MYIVKPPDEKCTASQFQMKINTTERKGIEFFSDPVNGKLCPVFVVQSGPNNRDKILW